MGRNSQRKTAMGQRRKICTVRLVGKRENETIMDGIRKIRAKRLGRNRKGNAGHVVGIVHIKGNARKVE